MGKLLIVLIGLTFMSCSLLKDQKPKDFKGRITYVLKDKSEFFKNCFQRELDIDEEFKLKYAVKTYFVIEKDGYASNARITNRSKNQKYDRFYTCIKNAIYNLRFDPHNKKEIIEVKQPFNFESRKI